jgi:hypothetical protein
VRIYALAIFVVRQGIEDVVYVGDAIEMDGKAWLVLTWESDDKREPLEKLPLEENMLIRHPPVGIDLKVDWHYLIRMGDQGTLQ